MPWWEQPQTPAWEKPQTPAWERQEVPAWQTMNPARTLLDRDRNRQQAANQQHFANYQRQQQYQPSVIYVLPPYRYFPNSILTTTQFVETPPPPTSPVTVSSPQPPHAPMGALLLDVEPKESLQIYVDGAFVGTPADHGEEIELTPGTRRIELRARGYRTLAFSAEIVDGRSITYRGSLEPAEISRPAPPAQQAPSSQPALPAPPGSRVMYMIPGCYLGNVSPKAMALPAGCDISKLTTILP